MKPYIPDMLPLKSLDWVQFIHLIGEANRELALYEGVLKGIVNPAILLTPLTTQEAVLSSKIEGTQATLEEVMEYEALPRKGVAKQEDIQEIINYRNALDFAVDYLKKKPIGLNLIKQIHEILLNSVRGKNKARCRPGRDGCFQIGHGRLPVGPVGLSPPREYIFPGWSIAPSLVPVVVVYSWPVRLVCRLCPI